MIKSLTAQTISGLNWNFIKTYGKNGINIVLGIILARIIPPEEFGLLGMTIIFTGFAELFVNLGIGPSIVRVKNLNDDHKRIGNTVTISSSILIYIVFWFLAPSIADFFNEPRILPIIRVITTLFFIKGITTVSYSLLVRNIDFKSILVVELSSFIIGKGIITLILAFLGFGVWSLVIGKIFTSVVSSIITFKISPIKLIDFIPLYKKKEFKELAGFGMGVSLSKILQYGSSNLDYFIIGKYLSALKLGLYTRAFNLMTLPINQISSAIYNVLYPAFAKVQNEPEKLRLAYLRTVKSVTFFIFPILAGMAVCAQFVILGLYGPKWEGSIAVFQILCIGGILRATLSYSGAVTIATGRVFIEVTQQIVYFTILGTSAFFAVEYGIEGVGGAVVLALIWMFLAQSYIAIKIIQSNWKNFIQSMIPGLFNMLVIVSVDIIMVRLINYNLSNVPEEIKLFIVIIANVITFSLLILLTSSKIKGDTISWLMEKYNKYIPDILKRIYLKFNPEK